MRTKGIAGVLFLTALAVLAAGPGAAKAAVLISSFQFKICVTGAKHPDGCRHAGADAHIVVSDDAMEKFEGEIGQGATIEAVPESGAVPAAGAQGHRRHQP